MIMILISLMPAYNVMGLKSGVYINKELSYCYVSVESICMMFETQYCFTKFYPPEFYHKAYCTSIWSCGDCYT
jgi:hypothetical protein